MIKSEFMEMFYNVIKHNKNIFKNDLPAVNLQFCLMLDNWNKSGTLTNNQVENWIITKKEYIKIKSILND